MAAIVQITLKLIFAILALSGILLQNASKLVILVNFRMNQEYIAKNLCVQKEVKNNCCQGKCHLTKELKEDDKKEQAPGAPSLKEKSEGPLLCQSSIAYSVYRPEVLSISLLRYEERATVPVSFSIFHPPCQA